MKTFSDTAITRQDLDHVDTKQTKQIKQLRIWLGVSFAANLIMTLALHFS